METMTQFPWTQFPWEPIVVLLLSFYGLRKRRKDGVGRREFDRFRVEQERRYTLHTERWARLAVRVGKLESMNGGDPT